MKRNENFWSYRLHKLGTLKVLRTDRRTDGRMDGQTDGRTDGRSGPTTRPAFAKATQVKIILPAIIKHMLHQFRSVASLALYQMEFYTNHKKTSIRVPVHVSSINRSLFKIYLCAVGMGGGQIRTSTAKKTC